MKQLLAIGAITALICNGLFAQISPSPDVKIYEMYDLTKEPSFPGGLAEMFKFISRHQSITAMSKDSVIGGKLVLAFIVDTSGNLTDIQIVKDIGGGFGKEAVNILKSMPAWTPGEIAGQKVRVKYILPMHICLR